METHSDSRLFYLFAHPHLLSSDSFSSLIFLLLPCSSLTLPTSAFRYGPLVGSFTSKLPSIGYILNGLLPWWKHRKANDEKGLHTCTSVRWCTKFHADLTLQGSAAEGVRSPLMTTGKKGSLLLCTIPDNGSKVTKPCNLFPQFGIGTPVSKHMRHYQIIAYGGVCSPTILGDVFNTGVSD